MIEPGLGFIASLCVISFIGALVYNLWRQRFYSKPRLARTQVSLEVDDDIIYLPHITSITEEYMYSISLLVCGFILGFALYMIFFFFDDFRSEPAGINMMLSVVLTIAGGLAGYAASLDKKTILWDSSGKAHELRLSEVERLEFKHEITKDIWRMHK
jgi:hypothetical protein